MLYNFFGGGGGGEGGGGGGGGGWGGGGGGGEIWQRWLAHCKCIMLRIRPVLGLEKVVGEFRFKQSTSIKFLE